MTTMHRLFTLLAAATLPSVALAIPSPDLVINLFASLGQVLGMLSVVFGGAAMSMRKRARARGATCSPWPFRIAIGFFVGTAIAFAFYASYKIDLDNKRLQAALTRSSSEEGKAVGDVSLKTLSYSDQLQHPLAIGTDQLTQMLAEGKPIKLVDVREKEETEAGMIRGARWLHYPSLLEDSTGLEEPGKQVVFVCYSGNRSGELCTALNEKGIDCKFMIGGYEKWISEDRTLDTNKPRTALRELPNYPNRDTLLDTPDIEALYQDGRQPVFVDVRYPGDFEIGHLPDAVNIPLRKMTEEQSRPLLEALPKDRPVVAPCYDKRSCFFSQILGLRLYRLGYDYRGRYSVPGEFTTPPKKREYAKAWEEQQQGKTLLDVIAVPLHDVLFWITKESGNFFFAILSVVLGLRLLLLPFSVKTEVDRLNEARRTPQIAQLKRNLAEHPLRLQRALRRIAREDRTTPIFNLVGSIIQLLLFLVLFTVVGDAAKDYDDVLGWMTIAKPDPLLVTPATVALLILLHMVLSATPPISRNKWLLYIGSSVLIFGLTFQVSAALNLYLLMSIGLLTVHGIIVRAFYRRHLRRKTEAPKPYKPSKDFGGIVPLAEITLEGGGGNKALKLGEMLRAGLPVPDGFSVTHQALGKEGLTPTERRRIEQEWRRIGAEKVAVRSSGLNEDGADKSYAGVFESKLEVTWEEFFDALEEVKQSLTSSRAAAYSGQIEVGGIVVQRMVDAEYAGVMFTEHPATSGSLMIEMVQGLGESLVSGQATPDSYQFGRYTGRPLFQGEPPIDVEPLIALGRKVERHYGRPQDIEWAYRDGRFYLLQTRDITSDSRTGSSQKAFFERERFRLLELFRGTPANQVVLKQNDLSELMPQPTRLSLSLMDRIWGPGGTVDLACSSLGIPYGVDEDSKPFVISGFGALYVNVLEQQKRIGKGPGMLAAFRLSRAAETIEREFREQFLPRYLEDVTLREAIDFRRLSLPELVQLFRDWSNRFITETYYQAELVNVAAEYYMQTARTELEKRGHNPAEYLGRMPQTVVSRAMALLPRIHRKQATLQEFLDLFGHRAPRDFELSTPRYREALDLVVKMAERAQEGEEGVVGPEARIGNQVLELAVQRARNYQTLKEEAKHYCLRDFALLRLILLELDRKLDLNGSIFHLDIEEVYRLADPSFMNEAYSLADSRKKQILVLDEELPLDFTPAGLETFGLDLDLARPEGAEEATLRGLRISGTGEGVGRVRVLTNAEQISSFEEGEVLVARFTDPTWTPVFSMASGVITEVGGWLSHAAILARELGVVGIVGVPNATRMLATGDLVRLHEDGTVEVSQRNRRSEMRYALNREASLWWADQSATARLINISRSGVYLQVADAAVLAQFETGRSAQLALAQNEGPIPFQVIRVEGDCLGLQFAEKIPMETINLLLGTTLEEEMRRTHETQGRLLQATLAVHHEQAFDSVLQRILSSTTQLMQADRSSLFIFDEATDELYSVITEGTGGKEIRIPSHAGIAGSVFTTGDIINIPDAYKDPRFNREVDKLTGFRTRSIICCPVIHSGKTLGVIQVLNKEEGPFSQADEQILRQYAEQSAIALENARIKNARDDQTRLLQATVDVLIQKGIKPTLERIADNAKHLVHAEVCSLFLHCEETDELYAVVAEATGGEEIRFPSDKGIAGSTFSTGKLINIPDAYADPRFNQEVDRKTGYRTRNLISCPVIHEGRLLGVIQLLNKEADGFTREDEQILRQYADQCALAIENARD